MGQFADLTDEAYAPPAGLAARLGAETPPDKAAEAAALSRRYGLPYGVAKQFAEDYKERALSEDANTIQSRAPRLGSWISQKDLNREIAHDDLPNMAEIESAIRSIPGKVARGARSIAAGFGPQFGAGAYGAAAYPFEALGMDRAGEFFRNEQRAAQGVADRVAGPMDPNAGILERGIMSGLRSAGQSAATLPIGMAGAPNAMLAMFGVPAFGQAYGKARDQGASVGKAGFYGLEDATAEVVTEKFLGAAKLIGDAKAGMSLTKLFVRDIAREIPGEIGATVWQNFNEWANLNPEKTLNEWLSEQPEAIAETIIATVVGGATQAGAVRGMQKVAERLSGEDQRAQQAEQTALQIEALTKFAEASKVRERDAQTFKDFVQQVADEEGDAPTEFYIDGAQLANTLNQSGMTMAELEAVAPTVASQLDAAAVGSDIRVPVSEFLAAGEAVTAPLIDHLRAAPDAMTRAEAQEYLKTEGDRIKSEVETELQQRVTREEHRQSIEALRDQFQQELDRAGRFTGNVNKAYAELLANYYVTQAERLGIAPAEFAQRYGLNVRSDVGQGGRTLEQDASLKPDEVAFFESVFGSEADLADLHEAAPSARMEDGQLRVDPEDMTGLEDWIGEVWGAGKKQYGGEGAKSLPKSFASAGHGFIKRLRASVGTLDQGGTFDPNDPSILNQAAADYQGSHKPPGPDSASLHDLNANGTYPDDVYGPNGLRWYGDGSGRDSEAFAIAQRLKGRPNATVTIYRAVPYEKTQAEQLAQVEKQIEKYMARRLLPSGVTDEVAWFEEATAERDRLRAAPAETKKPAITINPGDWVTLTRDYAREHGRGALGGNYKIISKTVTAKELFTNGDSIQEWGYWPANTYSQDERPAAENGAMPRAQIALPSDFAASPAVVSLLEGADLSSFIHESGHLFLEVQSDVAVKIQQQIAAGATVTEGERAIVEDMNRLLEWFGVKGNESTTPLDEWSGMTLDEKRESHEKFARGFEAYAMEGRAPSIELQGIFQRFRSWLLQVYQTLRNLKVDLNDDVRAVMGRMLASDFAIEEAEAQRNMGPLFKDAESAGMTLDEFNAYQATARGATEQAIAELQTRGMKDMKWLSRARDKALKARQEEVEAQRREIRNEVRAEVYAEPVYRAWQFLTMKADRQDTATGVKQSRGKQIDLTRDNLFTAIAKHGGLNREEVSKAWGIDPKDKLESGVFGMPVVRKEGGRSIDAMLELLVEDGYILPDESGRGDVARMEEVFDAQRRGVDQFSTWHDYAGEAPAEALTGDKFAGKLNTDELRRMYGTGETALWRKLSARRMTSDTGIDPDVAAETFGFDSGDAMVKALADATPPSEVIEARTDQRMLEMFGDITSQEALERAADEAVHNEARARFIASELKALQAANDVKEKRGKTSVNVMAKAAKEYAAQIIARLKVRELRPNQYATAEARNARLAEKAMAAGKTEEAAMHKRNQLVNNYATKAAYDAQAEVKSAQTYFRKFDKRSKSIDPEYQDQIEGLLERFDFKPASLKAVDRRKSFAAWVEQQRAKGIEPQVPEELLDEANRKSFKDMTLEEIRGLRETVEQIEHLGRLKNKLLRSKDQREFDAVAEEMAASIVKYGGDARPVELEGAKGVKPWLEGVAASHRKLASLFRQMDGGHDDGPMYEFIGRGMNEQGTVEDVMVEQATLALRDLYAPLLKLRGGISGFRSKQFIPAINASLTRGGRLAVALNYGNEQNRQRLRDGDKWTDGQILAVINTLSPTELAFVNGVWEYLDSYWPEVAAKEKRLTGVEPEKVVAAPFNVIASDGTEVAMRGGYYPLKYDTDRSDRAEQQEAAQVAKEMMEGAYARAQTRRGHTKARVEEVKRAVRKDLNVITQHVTQVVHDLAWHEWLIDTNRLLGDERVVDAIRTHYGPKVLKTMRDGVIGIATADVVPQTDVDKALLLLRSNVTRATMGASVTTAFLQPFGLTQSMSRIGSRYVLRGAARWGGDALRMESTIGWINERSEFMRLRSKTFNRELREIRGSVAGKSKVTQAIDAGLFVLMQKMQLVADVPTWIGQYEKSKAEGLDEDAAVAQADRAVLESQGGGQTKDLSEVQRKHPMLTQFYSYFNVTMNLAAEKTATTDFKNPRAVAGWMGDMALLMVIPAILPSLLLHAMKGGDTDDEEDLAKRIAQWQLGYLLGTIVGVRELSGAVSGFDYAGPPVGRVVADIGKAGKQTAQGEVDEAAVLAYANLIGTAFGIPVVQILRSYKGWKAWDEGEAGPQAVLFGPPPRE